MGKGINQSVTIDLDGNLPGRSKQFGRALSQMGERGERHLGRMARMSRTAGRSIDRLGNRYTALLSGAAIAAATKQVGDLSERYTRLGINANLSERQVQDLKQSVFDVSQAPDIRVDPAEMLSAIEDIVEKTGDLDFAKANIENIGLAIQATGATGANVGAMLAEFQKQGITAPGEVLKVIDSLNLQGKEGAFTLKDLAQLGPRVVSAYNATGRSGVQAMKEMGAALQVIRMGTDSSATAATAFEATLRTLSDPKKIEQLKELGGVEVFDPELLKQGKQQLKPINELMVEIIKASGGKQTNLGQIFDGEAMRAFNTILGEFKRTGVVESLDRFIQIQGDGQATLQDSARAAREFNSAVTYLKSGWDEFANNNLAGPIKELADFLHSADEETISLALNTGKWVAGIGGALIAGRKIFGLFSGINGLVQKAGASKAIKGAAGALSSMKPIPVFVVNNGKGGNTGAGGAARKSRRAGAGNSRASHRQAVKDRLKQEKLGKRMKGFKGSKYWGGNMHSQAAQYRNAGMVKRGAMRLGSTALGAGGMALGAGVAGYEVGGLIYEQIDETSFADKLGGAIAQALANFGSEDAQRSIDRRMAYEASKSEVRLKIDSQAPVRVESVSASNGTEIDVDVGITMEGM